MDDIAQTVSVCKVDDCKQAGQDCNPAEPVERMYENPTADATLYRGRLRCHCYTYFTIAGVVRLIL
jgi:hypothetical protein